MKRLFKEVWRSLFKNNKVVVAGLTILIFLTSGIFTLLNDTYQSMSRQYNSYKLKSKTHDLTVDFNLNANGNAYNNGYYINGLTQNDSHIDYDKALRYVSVDQNGEPNFKQNYKIIDFNVLQNQEYLNLSNFFSSPEEKEKFASQYIKTSDLLTLYSNYNNEKDTLEEQPLLNLEFTDQGQQIVLKNHYLINSYVKENGKYSLNINSRTLNNSSASVFAFDKTYKLSDLVSINNENDFIVISQVPEMYINLSESNPIATFDLIKARKWKEENKLIYTLNSKSVAGALGFLPKNGADDKFRRIINQSGDYGLINFDENDTLENIYEKSLKNLFSYSNVFNSNEITASAPQQFEFEANKKYHIPYEWTALQENYTFYTRKHYRLTYDNFHKKDWTGTYLSFIENLEKNNEITPEMVQFSLWTKLHKSYIRNYDSQGNLSSLKELNDLESNSIVSYDEANQVNLRFAEPQYQEISPQTLDRKILKVSNENISLTTSINDFYYLENPQTIARIETYGPTLTLKQYNDISNRNIRNEKFDFIKNGALKITKQNIYNQIAEKVGRENIGIRQSITVDSFNNNEKYVFHLVNTGNSDAEINGIKNNLNKLTSDEKDFSIYGNKIDAEQVFNSKQIPPFVSKTIIAQAKSNVSPDPEYINIDLTYSDVRFFDYDTKELQILSGKKIYKLSKYGYDLEPNFANLGVTWNGNKLILIHPVYKDGTQEISYWENTSLKINKNGEITIDEFFNLINSDNNQLTIKAEIGKDGWIAKSDIYSNWLYVPFGYRGPDSEVVLEATNFNTLNKALEKVEKNLLETTLIKDGFITKDVLYNFQKSFAIAAEKNNFASIFSEGSVNLNIVPKLILDTLYEMTHSSNGDYINKMLVSILTRIKQKILENPKDKQKEYLVQQFEKFDNFMKVAIGDLAQYPINWASFINLVKDPVVVLDNLINLVNAIDIKRFTDFTNDFFTNEYNKYFDINGNRLTDEYVQEHPNELAYQRKFSYHEMILWFLQSINWDNFKQALMNIIDNVNLSFILDINNSNNPFSYLLKSLPFNIEAILRQVDENPNLSGLHYQNIIRGIKELINVFDLNVFINLVNERIKTDRFDLQEKIFDETFNTDVTLNRHYILKYLTQTDWIYSLLKTFFNVPNSNKQIKQILINMFNLSSKGTSIKLDKDTYLTIPTADHDKLDYFDLLSLTAQKNQAEQNDNDVNSFMNLANVIEKIKDLDSVKLNDLSKGDRQTLNLFFGWKLVDDQNNEIIYSKEEIKKKINIWTKILAFVQYHGNDENLAPQMSISDLFAYFINNTDTSNNVLFYSIVQKALGLFDKFNASNKYSYLKPAYSLTSLFFKAMQLDLPMVAKIEFLNSLIALANNPELLKEVNSFDLSEANSKNIVAASDSGFGVTYSLAYPEKFSNRLFTEQNASKAQNLVHDWISDHLQFSDFINENKVEITKLFAYIGTSQLYNNYAGNETIRGYKLKYNNLLSVVLDNLINGMLSDSNVQEEIKILNYVLNTEFSLPVLSSIGISDVLINPLLRNKNPQLLVWMLTDTNSIGKLAEDNSNLSYFLNEKITNFYTLFEDEKQAYKLLSPKKDDKPDNIVVEKDNILYVAIDNDYIVQIQKAVDSDLEKYTPFGLNLIDIMIKGMNSITSVSYSSSILKFNEIPSYFAKVNFSWLQKNNKKIYTGAIPNNPIQITQLLSDLPSEYKVNISGSEFIIIGEDISFDYLYPVVDENNIQVNTKNQAIIYVNQYGFDRIRQSFRGNVVKEYLTVKVADNTPQLELLALQKEFENIVIKSTNQKTGFKRVYLATEIDPINPERAMRIYTTQGIVKSVRLVSLIFLVILLFLVTVSIIFIIKRYISNKNKVIGILVAQGYSPMQIAISLTTFAFFTIFLGGLLGYFAGFLMHGLGIGLLQAYWTIPIKTLNFSIISLVVNILVPLVAMSILIIFIALHSLRYKAIDLMSGIVELNTSATMQKISSKIKTKNVKSKFSFALLFNSTGKLLSFAVSVILASITTVFAFGTFGVFDRSINSTYQNRHYTYKYDLASPTSENGPLNPFYLTREQLNNSLYVPVGNIKEANLYQNRYFAAGYSPAFNDDEKNGNPSIFDGHIVTQFSVNIKIGSSVSVDPWELVYNSLPDTQKSRIIKVRDKVGFALQSTQPGLVFEKTKDANGNEIDSNLIDGNKTKENIDHFFYYLPNFQNTMEGKFYYYEWNNLSNKFERQTIATNNKRDEYRQFLVNAYAKLYEQNEEKLKKLANAKDDKEKELYQPTYDFFVGFNSIYYHDAVDEGFTYVASNLNNQNIKLYGYKSDSTFVKVTDKLNNNLLNSIDDEFTKNNKDLSKPIPVVINNVSKSIFNLKEGDTFTIDVKNHVNRFKEQINKVIDPDYQVPNHSYTFKVIAIADTYINNEFIISKEIADKLTGLDTLATSQRAPVFNGILSKDHEPQQLIWSTGLYSNSGYNPSIDSFNTDEMSNADLSDMFDAIYGGKYIDISYQDGNMISKGYTPSQIIKWLNPNFDLSVSDSESIKREYELAKQNAAVHIQQFAKIYHDDLYIATASSIDAKEIEVGYTKSIAATVQIIITIISIICFLVSVIILVIISTILINENEKNIAIWSILGYNNREKIKMFFGIYIPFILGALLIAIPLGIWFMFIFSSFLTASAAIAIPLNITLITILLVVLIVFTVFIITSIISWRNINKIKAVDLLKGK